MPAKAPLAAPSEATPAGSCDDADHADHAAPTRRSYHHGNLRDELVRQGMALLEAQGMARLSMREVARQIGVAQTAPLHHFEGKTGLLAAIAAQGFRELFAFRMQALQHKRDPEERLVAVMLAFVEFARSRPALFQLMHGPEIPDKSLFPELDEAATRSYALLETCVADHLQATDGSIDRSREATLAAWTACSGLATILTNPQNTPRSVLRKDPMGIARTIVGMFLRGLSERPG
ncbi:TetR/AcrR family transcriptional regulator [Pseudorhodoferax soli]|uniref:TetR family transcriptional regulator n=1 Tax=Pseudorhodoferax soli TaxID=545864 RepID=A0A368X823_9BURK|nr:TetR/AcrR family transcriptional regulator [Pseudorhodoferax soli]RCW64113.1 TetR family transcriptional regulator [Pseudorhodoferax soli]